MTDQTVKLGNEARQYPLVAVLELDLTDPDLYAIDGSVGFDAFELPHDAIVIGGDIVVNVASDAVGADALDVGDAGDVDRYADGVDLKAAARTALVLTGFRYSGESIVTFTRATGAGDAPAAGRITVTLQYIVVGRSNENQGGA